MAVLETLHGYKLWHYLPNIGAAVFFAIVFFALTVAHAWYMYRHRMWFCIPFVVGGLFEIIGYIGRVIAHDRTGELGPYIIQSVLLLLAPVLFAATLYMTLSRVIRAVDAAHCSIVPPRRLTGIFVSGDIFSFLVQSSGAGLLAKGSSMTTGSNIVVGGLILQIVIFAVFIVTAALFHRRFATRYSPHGAVMVGAANTNNIPWESTLVMLYATSVMILVRNVFRTAEYAMGNDGYLLGTEWGVYVFDAVLMAATMGIFLWRYPNKLKGALKRGDSVEMVGASV